MREKARFGAILLLVGAIAFNAITLWPEVAVSAPVLNDDTLHLALVRGTVEALAGGQDPTDFWVPYFDQGYPLFHHYQHLPHLATAFLFEGLGRNVPLPTLYHLIRYLLLCTFPLSLYWAGRRLRIAPCPAALAGLLAALLSSGGLYGLDMSSYVWRGYGLYTQLWGMWLLPPALAGLYRTLRDGRAYLGTALLVAATLLSHMVLGYVALLSGVLFLFRRPATALVRRAFRLGLVLLLVALLAAYFVLPFLLDRLYMNRSVWEDPGKYDAYGWPWTLQALWSGRLLDAGRFPSLTLLTGLGLLVALVRARHDDRYRMLLLFFLLWLALYFGRPTWGVLLNLLPLSHDLHLHRLIVPVHLGAIALAGVGLAWLWERALALYRPARPRPAWKRLWAPAGAALLTVGLLGPAYAGQTHYLARNGDWLTENAAAYQAEKRALEGLLAHLRTLPPGRVYAGRATNWGNDYRVGSVPLYAFLSQNGIENPGYLYHALSLNADIEGYLEESRPATFDLFNIRYLLAPVGQTVPAFARPVVLYGRHMLYRVETSGFFDLVEADSLLCGPREDWFPAVRAWLQSDWVEAKQHPRIVLSSCSDPALPLAAFPQELISPAPLGEPCGRILREKVEPGLYTVEFEATRACWLLLKATFHPGWRVTLDGRPAEVAMLAPSFPGIAVGSGRHQATFRYEPGPLRAWLQVTGLAALLLAAVATWQEERLRHRGRQWWARLCPGAIDRLTEERTWHTLALRWREGWQGPAIVLVFALLAGLPTLQLQQMSGHDALEYLPRAVEFYRALQAGQIPPRWAPDLSQGYGQPFFLFNPPLIYALTAVFHALGASLVASLNWACLLLLALAGLGMYLFARDLLGQEGGIVAGAAYLLAPYTLAALYVRYALADFAAMVWIPWALWGMRRWTVRERRDGFLLTTVATALLPLSSNPVALLAAPLLGLYLLLLAWRGRDGRVLGRGALALSLGLALSAFFWLPAIAERHWVKLANLLGGPLHYSNHFVYPQQLIYSPWGFGLSLPGPEDGMSFSLGLLPLVMLGLSTALALFLRRQLQAQEGWYHLWFFSGVLGLTVFLVTPASRRLWDALPLLQYLQFPWRALALAALAGAWFCAFPFLSLREEGKKRRLRHILLGALLLTALPYAHPEEFYPVRDADYAPEVIAAQGIRVTTTGEYEPVWATIPPGSPPPEGRLIPLAGQVRILEQEGSGTAYTWLLEAAGPAWIRLAIFYYPGWQLTIEGLSYPLQPAAPFGLIEFNLGSGIHRVELAFRQTPLRRWAMGLSAGATLFTAGLLLWPARRRSKGAVSA